MCEMVNPFCVWITKKAKIKYGTPVYSMGGGSLNLNGLRYLLAHLEDDLLQQIGELLHNGHRLAGGQADAVHRGGGVVARLAQARRRTAALITRIGANRAG